MEETNDGWYNDLLGYYRLYFGPIETVGRGVVRSSVRSATAVGSSCSAVSPEVTCRLRSAARRCGCGWSQPAGT